jgi:hypothetical protein
MSPSGAPLEAFGVPLEAFRGGLEGFGLPLEGFGLPLEAFGALLAGVLVRVEVFDALGDILRAAIARS